MLLNQDQDLLADLSIAICSSCNLATSFGDQYAVCDQYADQYVSVVLADSRHTSARFHLPLALPHVWNMDPMSDHCMVSPDTLCYALLQYILEP